MILSAPPARKWSSFLPISDALPGRETVSLNSPDYIFDLHSNRTSNKRGKCPAIAAISQKQRRWISFPNIFIIFFLTVCIGCHSAGTNRTAKLLSQSEALELAVKLANEKSMAQYSVAPFDSNSYEVLFSEGHWTWGGLDPAGINGYSANVTFDAHGMNRTVEVFWSTDQLMPVTRDPDQDDQEPE
jgi:hypothetical protein